MSQSPAALRPPVRLLLDDAAGPVRVGTAATTQRRLLSATPDGLAPGLRARLAARLSPAWPLQGLLCLFPLWWVAGLNTFIFPIMAVPMAIQLLRQRRISYPPLFWLWMLFQAWQVIGLALVGVSPDFTHPGSLSGRVISTVVNLVEYAAITVTLLYVTNLPAAVSNSRIARWLGWFFLTVAAGGFLGLALPHLQFPSLLELVLPHALTSKTYVHVLVHPITAQVQDLISSGNPRPSAPFGYTNSWGYAISVLGLWFIAGWVVPAVGRRRWWYLGIVALTLIPVIFSLNRGLWIGVLFSLAWMLGRDYVRGNVGRVLAAVTGVVLVFGVAFFLTPAGTIVTERLNAGDSNQIRAFVADMSIKAAPLSPVVGFGSNRHSNGSASSIAIGKTNSCVHCGDVSTGSTGQLWSVLFNQGIVGTVIYFGYFLGTLWVFRRERGAVSEAALLTTALVFVYMFVYVAIPVAPTLTVIATAILARQRRARLAGAADETGTDVAAVVPDALPRPRVGATPQRVGRAV